MDKNSSYRAAPELNEPVRKVINEYHPYLKDAKIACLFRKGSWQVKDRPQLGRAVVAPPVWRSLTGFELLVIVNEGIYLSFTDEARVAQLDHILSFIKEPVFDKNGAASYGIKDYDICEHSGVVNRHNICFSNLKAIDENGSRQLDMLESLEKQAADGDLKGAVEAEEALAVQEAEEEEVIVIEEHESEDELEGEVIRKFEFGD